jgi:hypothetical protein
MARRQPQQFLLPVRLLVVLALLALPCRAKTVGSEHEDTDIDEASIAELLDPAFVSLATRDGGVTSNTDDPRSAAMIAQQHVAQENATLFELFTICRSDYPCALAFSLGGSAQDPAVAPGASNSLTRAAMSADDSGMFCKFKSQLLLAMARPDSPFAATRFGEELQLDTFDPEQADVWLRIMRTIRPCPDGLVWRRAHGCVCPNPQSCASNKITTRSDDLKSLYFGVLVLIAVVIVGFAIMYLSIRKSEAQIRADFAQQSPEVVAARSRTSETKGGLGLIELNE